MKGGTNWGCSVGGLGCIPSLAQPWLQTHLAHLTQMCLVCPQPQSQLSNLSHPHLYPGKPWAELWLWQKSQEASETLWLAGPLFLLLLMVLSELPAWSACFPGFFSGSFCVLLSALGVQMGSSNGSPQAHHSHYHLLQNMGLQDVLYLELLCLKVSHVIIRMEECHTPELISQSWTFLDFLFGRFWVQALWACFLFGILLGFPELSKG